ncbi:hypothetical protein AX774_g467 [Zancudomyces culisetae]|uniref:Uncharacterized protein n=1 Tax=Zancudomyces culisetae TaxID=1213189 RepID=A0A1R1PYH7_ZANCU|nr:hypothetical protein AX774_g467 [Zancudomyces culisetae]|eukprot:OMH86003.1 hypothetical protein AX774_g467 [Zancudomyces culisetae]
MCVFNSGEVTIRAQHLYSISGRDVHPLPKSGCTYLFYEVETVAPSALKGPIEHLVEYSVCETKNGCLLEAKTISLDFGKTRSMPIKNNCKFSLFMPHFSLDSSFA